MIAFRIPEFYRNFYNFHTYFYYSRAQMEAMEKEQAEEQDQHVKRLYHAEDVRKQIREKEQLKVGERNAFFEEGVKIKEEANARRARLDNIKGKKLKELR